jgi:hypothetical protein
MNIRIISALAGLMLYSLEQFIAQVSIKTIVVNDGFALRSERDA